MGGWQGDGPQWDRVHDVWKEGVNEVPASGSCERVARHGMRVGVDEEAGRGKKVPVRWMDTKWATICIM